MQKVHVHRLSTPTGISPAPVVPMRLRLSTASLKLVALAHQARATAAGVAAGETERSLAQRNALIAFTVRCVSAALLYLSQIALARWMGGYDYGIYVFVWTWVLILGGLSHLGLNVAVIRLAPVYRERGDARGLAGLIHGSRFFAVGAGTGVMLAGMTALYAFSGAIEQSFVLPVFLGLICVPMYALTDVQDGIGRGHGWMGSALIPPYVLRPVLVLAAMAAARLAGLPTTAATAAGAAVLATWGSVVIQTICINRRVRSSVERTPRRYDFPAWFRVSLPLCVILACELGLQNTDILVLSHYLSPADVGVYFAAGKTMSLIMFVHYAVGSAVANQFAALDARGDTASLKSFVRDAANWTFWPSLAAAAVLLTLGRPLLSLFGPQFAQGFPVMVILVVGFLFRAAMGPVEFLLNMLGEQKLCAMVLASAAALNIVLNFALVPPFGLTGAATATAIALVTAALANAFVASRRLGIKVAIWHNLPFGGISHR